jgi:hypothetical protein
MRSELLTETTVRGSMRVDVTRLRGSADVLATASAGATAGGLMAAESAPGAGTGAGFDAVVTAAGAAVTSLEGAIAARVCDGTAGLACWTTSVDCPATVAGSVGLAPGVAIVVIGRIGSTTTGADGVGIAMGGAGVVRSVVSGRAAPGFSATQTLSPTGDAANTAVMDKASSIIAVGQQRSEVVL